MERQNASPPISYPKAPILVSCGNSRILCHLVYFYFFRPSVKRLARLQGLLMRVKILQNKKEMLELNQ